MCAERKVPGRPFKKGHDPNRHKLGRISRQRAGWMDAVLNALALEVKPKEAARLLAKWYKQGRLPVVMETHERLGGKVTQPVSGELSHTLKFRFGDNGNGGSEERDAI